MPRPRPILVAAPVTSGEAAYVLERLIADRRITPNDVHRYVTGMHDEIIDLERRLHTLRNASAGSLPPRATPSPIASSPQATTPKRRRRSLKPPSAEVTASRQLQGQYVSLIRQIPKYRRVQYQKIAKERGREEAVTQMRKALGK
jgi:O6-methylguanine-DNA--protein-cysteine methyltransferase